MFSQIRSLDLFPTPFVIASLAEETRSDLNQRLEAVVMARRAESTGVQVSNRGGWQSDANITDWGGEPIQELLQAIQTLLNEITLHLENNQYQRRAIPWKINGWANINRQANTNALHTHPGAYWSAVYYVRVPEEVAGEKRGGELELFDPRGTLPLMYCPVLRFGIKGSTSAGASELYKPKAGECVIFPSWLPHAVNGYEGGDMRISLAFNFSV